MSSDNLMERRFVAGLSVFEEQLGVCFALHSSIKPPPNRKSDKEFCGLARIRNEVPRTHHVTTTRIERSYTRNAGFIRQGVLYRGVLPDESGVAVVLTTFTPVA